MKTIHQIFEKYPEDFNRAKSGDTDICIGNSKLMKELYKYFVDNNEIPYEVVRAKGNNDPDTWILNYIQKYGSDQKNNIAAIIIHDEYITKYINEIKEHFNEPILVGFELVRLVGYSIDEDDFYLVYADQYGPSKISFVGGYTYLNALKNQNMLRIDDKVYNDFIRLDNFLEMNCVPKVDKMIEWFGDNIIQ